MVQQRGVTLMELMITVAIIGILGAIALPAYRDYVIRGHLADAHAVMGATRTRLEQYYQDNRSYPGFCGGTGGSLPAFTTPTSDKFTYTCAVRATAGQDYVLTATGTSGGPTVGFTYTVDDRGQRATTAVPTGWATNAQCWVNKKPNGC